MGFITTKYSSDFNLDIYKRGLGQFLNNGATNGQYSFPEVPEAPLQKKKRGGAVLLHLEFPIATG